MAKDADGDYFYDSGTINESFEHFQFYEENGTLYIHDTRTDDVVKVKENGEVVQKSLSTEELLLGSDGPATSFSELSGGAIGKHVVLETVNGRETFKLDSRASSGSTYPTLRDAILEALNTLDGLSGAAGEMGTVHLPYGQFTVGQSITLDLGRFAPQGGTGSIRILGRGNISDGTNGTGSGSPVGTILVSEITNGNYLFTTGDGSKTETGPEHLEVFGVGAICTGDEGDGLRFTGADEMNIRHCGVLGSGGRGIVNYSSQTGRYINCTVRESGGPGIDNRGGARFVNCESEMNSRDSTGFLHKGTGAQLTNCDIAAGDATGATVVDKSGGVTIQETSIQAGDRGYDSDGQGGIRLNSVGITNFTDVAVRWRNTGTSRLNSVLANSKLRPASGANGYFSFFGGNVAIARVRKDERNASPPLVSNTNSDAKEIDWPDEATFNGKSGVNPSSATYTASFDTLFTSKPTIEIRNLEGGVSYQGTSNWTTDANGNYTGVDLNFSATPSLLTWKARPNTIRA